MAVWVVDQAGGGDATTINGAVALASSGDTIFIRRGEYKEEVDDSGKQLIFIFEGYGLVQGEGTSAKGFTFTGGSIVQKATIEGFTIAGVEGGYVADCEIRGIAGSIGVKDALEVRNSLLTGHDYGTNGTIAVVHTTIADTTVAVKDCEEAESLVLDEITTGFELATSDGISIKDIAFGPSLTNYADIGGSPVSTLADFIAAFGTASGYDVAVSFLDAVAGFYGSETDTLLVEWDGHNFPAGYSPVFAGITANVNSSLLSRGIYVGSTFDGTKVTGVGTVATGVLDLHYSREITDIRLLVTENITAGDKVEKTANQLDIEFRGSDIKFEKDDGVLAWQTVERRKAPAGTYRYWQFRMTLTGSAELRGIALGLERLYGDMTVPTWPGMIGIASVAMNLRNGLDITFQNKDSDQMWRLYLQASTAVGLYDKVNLVGEFDDQTIVLYQDATGIILVEGTTYYFGARVVSPEAVEDTNTSSISLLYEPIFSYPSVPDIDGRNLGRGTIEIELVDAPVTEPIYSHTIILREMVDGFTQVIGTLVNNGDTLEVGGFVPGTVERFIAVAMGINNKRSRPSEEVRLMILDELDVTEPREMIYT